MLEHAKYKRQTQTKRKIIWGDIFDIYLFLCYILSYEYNSTDSILDIHFMICDTDPQVIQVARSVRCVYNCFLISLLRIFLTAWDRPVSASWAAVVPEKSVLVRSTWASRTSSPTMS